METTETSSSSSSDNEMADSITANTNLARIDDDVDELDDDDRTLDSLAQEIERDMESDGMPPAYSPSLRPDTPDSGFADVSGFQDSSAGGAQAGWTGSLDPIGNSSGNPGSSWTPVEWGTLGKSAPPANSSRTSSTADNYVKVDAEDDMVVVEKEE